MMISPANRLPAICALSAAGGFLFWLAVAYLRAGVFEYPLDDVYIHLAMANGIMGGTYGINPGEPASAASSVFYPFLLLPFPGTEFQRFLPLFWNAAALAATAWIFGKWVAETDNTPRMALFLAILAPFALNMVGVATLGMEHTLHGLATALILAGLWRFLKTGMIGGAFVAALVLSPLLRFEGLALSLAATAALAANGRYRFAMGLGAAIMAPVGLFSLFLIAQGLDPLPSSVLSKVGGKYGGYDPIIQMITNVISLGGVAFFGYYLALTLAFFSLRNGGERSTAHFLLVVWAAGSAHLFLGKVGWLARYEQYFLLMAGAALVLCLPMLGRFLRRGIIVGSLLASGYYGYMDWRVYGWSPRTVYLQQYQMARLASELPGEPVAANDIGWVSWKRSGYVLDLWGLASPEARRLRKSRHGEAPPAGWAADLTERHGVRYAMVYAEWINDGIGTDWRAVAELTLKNPRGIFSGRTVTIYATDPDFEDELRAAVRRLTPSMPPDAILSEIGP